MKSTSDKMSAIVSLCKRRGFVFQSSEIYGGIKSLYDFGPLGVELKRNIANSWWRYMVSSRDDVYGLDSSVIMHPKVWEASGHLQNFSDPLVDCLDCKERFRADKVPRLTVGDSIEFGEGKKKSKGVVSPCGYVCPKCSSPNLSKERLFRGMFQTTLGPVDAFREFIDKYYEQGLNSEDFFKQFQSFMTNHAVYLRPETAQGMFVQFLNVQQTMSAKVPFGIAQIGKSFRNEIVTEHFIFRSAEFEQMEMEFFCEPGTQKEWMDYWVNYRMDWYKKLANEYGDFRLREHASDELAHYSDRCFDVEYQFPWGWDELEGIASRKDYDLTKHTQCSNAKLTYFDQQKEDPQTGKMGWRYTPYVIEPAAGLTRAFLCFMLDAYQEEEGVDSKGESKSRVYLKFHPALAPIKVAVFPLLKKDGQPEMAHELAKAFRLAGLTSSYDEVSSIGKRYAKHDEIGTPYCVTVDGDSLSDNCVTVRDRDTTKQERISISTVVDVLKARMNIDLVF